jgi:ATP-dependent Clp protease ATP-binding subunit ClpB
VQLSPCLAGQPLRTDSFELIAIKAQLELKQEASMCATTTVLSPTLHSPEVMEFEAALRSRIIGQQEGLQALVDLYQVLSAGLNSPGRPLGSLLFLGPTGTGKTRLVEAAAEILFGNPRAMIKVDCGEFQHSHEIAKLVGSPPGYLGHRETHAVLTQEALEQFHTEKLALNFLLFDEIEKASDALWQLLLGILDKATLTLGDNRRVDLSRTLVFLTSNLGASGISDLMSAGFGFIDRTDKPAADLEQRVARTAAEAARRTFSPEFINRLDKVVVFNPLSQEQLREILELELQQVQMRVLQTAKVQFLFHVRAAGKDFLLREGTDPRYGARHLKRAVEQYLVCPLANLLATRQVRTGDMLCVDWDRRAGHLVFWKEGRVSELTTSLRMQAPVRHAQSECGRMIEFPSPAPRSDTANV